MADKPKSEDPKGQLTPVSSASAAADADTQELVFTIKPSTGEVVKIETLENGTRQELSDEQYATIAAYLNPSGGGGEEALTGLEAYEAAGIDPYPLLYHGYAAAGLDFEGAYYQGIADYAAAVEASIAASYSGYTPEELAYYQGMADYAASIC